MAEPYKVIVSPEALVEVVRAATWWREHRPEIGTVARSKHVRNARVLQLTRSRYRVFYQVLPLTREVLVLHVRHGSRRPVKLRR
jgi:hypothetical protein